VTVPTKPTVADLGVAGDEQEWMRSGSSPDAIEVAFASALGARWVLMRVAGAPDDRVQVFTVTEWASFLDGAKKGEFDDAATRG
jgi:hypothetical protein